MRGGEARLRVISTQYIENVNLSHLVSKINEI